MRISESVRQIERTTLGARSVLYSNDFEPITVLELSPRARSRLEVDGEVVIPVMEPVTFQTVWDDSLETQSRVRSVWIVAEMLRRRGKNHLMLFTQNDEDALLLKAAFLPGQRGQVKKECADAFAKGFLEALRIYF